MNQLMKVQNNNNSYEQLIECDEQLVEKLTTNTHCDKIKMQSRWGKREINNIKIYTGSPFLKGYV